MLVALATQSKMEQATRCRLMCISEKEYEYLRALETTHNAVPDQEIAADEGFNEPGADVAGHEEDIMVDRRVALLPASRGSLELVPRATLCISVIYTNIKTVGQSSRLCFDCYSLYLQEYTDAGEANGVWSIAKHQHVEDHIMLTRQKPVWLQCFGCHKELYQIRRSDGCLYCYGANPNRSSAALL